MSVVTCVLTEFPNDNMYKHYAVMQQSTKSSSHTHIPSAFRALTLFVGHQEGHLACKDSPSAIHKGFPIDYLA